MQVSVIVPVQDSVEHLERAVESAIAQQETAEVLLIANGASAASLAACEQLVAQHARVRLYSQLNGAVANRAASRNLGVQQSRYDVLAFLNPNTYYLVGRFGTSRALFESSSDVDGVFDRVGVGDEALLEPPAGPSGETPAHLDLRPRELLTALAIGYGGGFHFDGLTVRRRAFARAGLFDEDIAAVDETVFRVKLAATCTLVSGGLRAAVAAVQPGGGDWATGTFLAFGERYRRARTIQRALRCWARESLCGPRATLVDLFVARCLAESCSDDARLPTWLRKSLKRVILTLCAIAHPRLFVCGAFWRIIFSFASPLASLRFRLPAYLWQRWLGAQSMPRERLVMFHAGRSGSTVLGDLLNQHPAIRWSGEIIPKARTKLGGPGARALLSGDPSRLLLDDMAGVDRPVYGCEVKFEQVEQLGLPIPRFVAALDRLGFRHVIVLERENTLRVIASYLVAQHRSLYEQPSHTPPKRTRVTIDPERVCVDGVTRPLLVFLRRYQQDFRGLRQLLAARNVLELTYEADVMDDPIRAYQRVCEYLGLEPRPVHVRISRSNPFRLTEIIENYDEIAQLLRRTEFSWMLDN